MVAEHAFGLLFAIAKRAAFQTSELRAGRWTKADNVYLNGKTLGVIGTGHIGAAMAGLARAVGMRVLAWTFNPTQQRADELGVTFVSLDELLAESDAVSGPPGNVADHDSLFPRGGQVERICADTARAEHL